MKKIILFLLAMWMVGAIVKGQAYEYFVNFEGARETKTVFATGTVSLSGKNWSLTEVLIGTLADDFKNGARSARLAGRNGAIMTMLEDKNFGLGTLSFQYRRYGTDGSQQPWAVEYSTDRGITWASAGSYITPTTEVQVFSAALNIPGQVRIRIRLTTTPGNTGDRRMNIDNILLTDYITSGFTSISTINFDNVSKWFAGSGVLSSFQSNHRYIDDNWVFSNGPALRNGTTLQDGVPLALGTYSWRVQGSAGTLWTATYGSRNTITSFGFKARRWDSASAPNWTVEYSTNSGTSFLPAFNINNTSLDNSSTWKYFQFQLPSPLLIGQGEFIIRLSRVSGGNIMIDDFTFGIVECVNIARQFRTVASGNWNNSVIWEYSDDLGTNWNPAGCVPNAIASLAIIRSNHLVDTEKNITLKNVTIESGATLRTLSGTLTFANHTGHTLVINSGGALDFNGGETPLFGPSATVLAQTGSIIRVSTAKSEISGILAGNGSLNRVFYENGAIFEWNTGIFETENQTYFPNAGNDVIPVFRTLANIGAVGAGSPTTINGLFVANGDITWHNAGTKTFRNGIAGPGSITQAAGCGPIVISGSNAQLSGGILQLHTGGLQINGNVVFGSNKIIAGGPVNVNGTLNTGSFDLMLGGNFNVGAAGSLIMNASTLTFNGGTIQSLTLRQPLVLNGLAIFNPTGITVNQDITIQNNLAMNGGNLDLGENILTLGTSGVQPGSLTRTSGAVTGQFRRWIPPVVSTDDILFPVGKGARYVPVSIRFSGAPSAGTLSGEFINIIANQTLYYGNLPIQDGDLIIDNISSAGYWSITASNGFVPAPYTIAVFPDTLMQTGLLNPSRARIVKRTSGASPWEIAGAFENGTSSQIRHTNVTTGFSQFALGGNFSQNPLPVELLHFEARYYGGKVLLEWSTATEVNNNFFSIERSSDTRNVVSVGYVTGAGNSNNILYYFFTDQEPFAGINYYRLKQTDFDGTVDFSDWIAVQVTRKASELAGIFQLEQKNHRLELSLKTREGARVDISVSDIHGRVVYQSEFKAASNLVRHEFAPGATGVLIITIDDGHGRTTERVLFIPR